MATATVLDSPHDLEWLAEVHKVPTAGIARAVLYGTEDDPDTVETFATDHHTCTPITFVANVNRDMVPQLPEGMFDAYVKCAMWSSLDDDGSPLDDGRDDDDVHPDALATLRGHCEGFLSCLMGKCPAALYAVLADPERAGHDLWLTQQRHGAGFWDGDWPEHGDTLTEWAHTFSSDGLYVGDDGKIHAH